MELFPAIDLRQGRVVRLKQGEATRQTVYGDDPAAVAERFIAAGARWIHVVDLDRAFDQGENEAAVRGILGAVGALGRIQLGGGFRSIERIRQGLDLGVSRIVIGTAAANDPAFLTAAAEIAPPHQLAVSVDTRGGMVALRGWSETAPIRAIELARLVVRQGVTTLIYTDISRDGMMEGPDLDGAVALRQAGARVIASGGVASLDDIRRIADAGLDGAIIGRALYEGRIDLAAALEQARRGRGPS